MVPTCSKLSGLELIGSGLPGSQRACVAKVSLQSIDTPKFGNLTFSDTINAIGPDTVKLTDAMPVDTGPVVLHGVFDIDHNHVSPICHS